MLDRQIRVLCVMGCLNRGGSESMCMNLYRNMDHDKIQFDFVKHVTKEGHLEKEILNLGGRIFCSPEFRIYNIIEYKKWWNDFFTEIEDIDIVHGHNSTLAPIYLPIAKKFGKKTILHSHNIKPRGNYIIALIKNLILKKSSKIADYNFACSNAAGKYLFGNEEYQVLHNAIDIKNFIYNKLIREKYRKELNIVDKVVIGTVGSITQPKNPLGIIEIFDNYHQFNSNSVLLWVGSGNNSMILKIKEIIKKKNLTDACVMLGNRNDIPDLLQAMDIFILPSLWEGLGMAAIEAQATGLPCLLSTNVPREVDITGNCSFIDLNEYDLWAEIIESKRLMKRNNMEDKIRKNGYDILYTSKFMSDFYQSIV